MGLELGRDYFQEVLVYDLVLGVSCFDQLGLLDLLSYCCFYELLAVVVQSGMLLGYLVYFLDHGHWDAYALPTAFSVDGSWHSRFKTQWQHLHLNFYLTFAKMC